jgi:hypothetical protein
VNTSTNTPSSNRSSQSVWTWGLPFAFGVVLLGAAMLLRATAAPIWLLRATIVAESIAVLWFLVAVLIWNFRVLRPSLKGETGGPSPEVPQLLWRLGGGRAPQQARKWGVVMMAGFGLAASLNSISGLPAWIHTVGILIAAVLVGGAYWQSEKIYDQTADELMLLIRQRALRFTIAGQFVAWVGVHFLNQAGFLPDFRWGLQHLGLLTLGLYLLGSLVASRRFV